VNSSSMNSGKHKVNVFGWGGRQKGCVFVEEAEESDMQTEVKEVAVKGDGWDGRCERESAAIIQPCSLCLRGLCLPSSEINYKNSRASWGKYCCVAGEAIWALAYKYGRFLRAGHF